MLCYIIAQFTTMSLTLSSTFFKNFVLFEKIVYTLRDDYLVNYKIKRFLKENGEDPLSSLV